MLPVFALTVAFGIAQAFGAPAIRSLPADMVEPEDVPSVVARSNIAGEAGIVLGPVLGGFLYAADVRFPFVALAALSAASGASILAVRLSGTVPAAPIPADPAREAVVEPVLGHAEAPPSRRGWREASAGLRFVRSRPVVLGAISLDLFAVLFGGAVALLPAIAKDRLGVGAVGLGWLQAAAGLGAACTTTMLALWPPGRRIGRTLLAVVAVFGAFTVLLGATRSYAVAFAAIFVLSGADAVSVFIRATLVPLATPEEMRGRVLAVENVFIGASNEFGGFESGVTAQLLGTSAAVMLGGAATLLVAGVWSVAFPALRRVDGFPTS